MYDVKTLSILNFKKHWKTLITRIQGTKIESDDLRGYVSEESFADVQNDRVAFRKFKLITEDGQGKSKTKLVNILIADSIGENVDKTCKSSYPLHNVCLRKIKMWKNPSLNCENSWSSTEDVSGAEVERTDGYEPRNCFKFQTSNSDK